MRPKLILGGLAGRRTLSAGADRPDSRRARSRPRPRRRDSQVGPATIAPHWSKYQTTRRRSRRAPPTTSSVRGDTLWDLSARFLSNPYLWPQIWDQNKYITDAHWIYPGDPIILPKVALVAERAGQAGAGRRAGRRRPEGAPIPGMVERRASAASRPLPRHRGDCRCSARTTSSATGEDESLYIVGLRGGRGQARLRRPRHPLPEQGQQRRREGRATSTRSTTSPTR